MRISDWSSDVCSSDLASKRREGVIFSTPAVQKYPELVKTSTARKLEFEEGAGVDLGEEEDVGRDVDEVVDNIPPNISDPTLRLWGKRFQQQLFLHITDREEPFYVTRSEEHTSELQSLMRTSYAVFCLKKKKIKKNKN